jgi:hypothetical protein
MFVRYYLELARPFDEVESALLSSPETWVPGLALETDGRARVVETQLGIGSEDGPLRTEAKVVVAPPVKTDTRTLLPMTWEAGSLFPHFTADVEVAPMGPDQTQLAISAQYRPPLGALGRAIDRILLRRAAEAIVKDFLDRVGERLAASAVAPPRR